MRLLLVAKTGWCSPLSKGYLYIAQDEFAGLSETLEHTEVSLCFIRTLIVTGMASDVLVSCLWAVARF